VAPDTRAATRDLLVRTGTRSLCAVSVIDVTERSFEFLVLDRSTVMPVVVDFWAPWCAPCLALTPLLQDAVAARAGEVVLAKLDIDLCPLLWRRYEVRTVPAVKAFRDREVVAEFTGVRSPADVERFFEELVASWARA
jgi:putative thioredoxin